MLLSSLFILKLVLASKVKFRAHFVDELGTVGGPVIQANGRLSFEDNLISGGLLDCVSQ